MTAVTVLSVIALAFAIAAAAAVTAVAVRGYMLARRVERLAEQIGRIAEGEFRQALVELAGAARGIRESSGNVDRVLQPLTDMSERLKRLAGTLTVEALVGAVLSQAGGLSAVWRGIAELVKHGRGANGAKR